MNPELEGLDVLLRDENDFPIFMIRITKNEPYFMSFDVLEVNSWENDANNTPSLLEHYLNGTIKWDGCSHVWFGERDEDNNQDGYLHLCGKEHWERHCLMMMTVYELAANNIKNYDKETAE